jgi:Ca-activated chloride channel family protein
LTDGEDHRSDPAAAAKEAAASGVRLFTIGIGSPEGEPIPLENGGYKKDPKGMTVVSRLDEGMLMEAAKISGGDYYRSTPSMDEISHISTKIKEGDPTQGLAGTTTRWKDRYSWPLTVALLLILLELVLPMRSRIPTKISLVMLGLLLHGLPAQSAVGDGTLRAANKKYHAGNYEEALDLYGQASAERPSDPRPIFNAGDALYRLDRSCEAAGAFNSIATHASADPHLRSAAFYNLGNSLYHDGQYAQAASAYRNSLALTPGDQDARRNLIIALQRQKNPPPKKKNDPNKKNQSPDQKENPQKQQENSQQPRSRPQNEMTQQEAERVMRAVAEKEKSARQAAKDQLYGRRNPPKSPTGEDW